MRGPGLHRARGAAVLAAGVLVSASLSASGWAQPVARVRFEPPLLAVPPGGSADVDVIADDVAAPGLAAFQLELAFDSAAVALASPADAAPAFAPSAWLLTATGRAPLGIASVDPAAGEARIAYATSGAAPPASGAGPIARISITAGPSDAATLVRWRRALLADGGEFPSAYDVVLDPLVVVVGGGGPDGDADGVPDAVDNCTAVPNDEQRDTNRDGFGNACDADYDDNGAVGISDFNALRARFGRTDADPDFDPDLDANGDGAIGIPDFNALRAGFGAPPGPSGRAR